MRRAAFVVMLTLLLPTPPVTGGRSDGPAPIPLDLFGGGPRPVGWSPPVLLIEAYYNALRPDEYVTLANVAGLPVDLSGWTITDGEGTLTFPADTVLAADAAAVVAQNSTGFAEDTLQAAGFRYLAGNATAMATTGSFQLANAGDEVIVRDPAGRTVDAFVYGASPFGGAGWSGPPAGPVGAGSVARRAHEAAWRDTNTSADWDLIRVRALGQSDVGLASFAFEGTATAFVSPDGGLEPMAQLLAGARSTIDVEVYTLTSPDLGAQLRAALGRGVRLRVLLEGGPVGSIDSDEWNLANDLATAGADVRFMVDDTPRDIQERFRYVHAKFAIIDNATVLVSSQNWGPSGFPSGPKEGSRGWSVAVTHAPLAGYFEQVFAQDFDARRRDIVRVGDLTVRPSAPVPAPTAPRAAVFPPSRVAGSFRVVPILAPDTSLAPETVLGAIRTATSSIHAELFYAYPRWDAFPDLYLEELLAASRRGVAVRLLLDASRSNVAAGDMNNTNTVAYVRGVASGEGLDVQAKLIDLGEHGLTELHTKGLVIDGRTVLVSSINWNRNSATANREAGLLVENPELAAYFDAAFAWDWTDDLTLPRADAGPDRTVRVGEPLPFSALGSSDDVAVTNWSWDLDGDGSFDRWGAEVAFAYARTGTFVARLVVRDPSNNTGEDAATVTVHAAGGTADSPPVVPAMALLAAAVAIGFGVRRRRQRLSKPP